MDVINNINTKVEDEENKISYNDPSGKFTLRRKVNNVELDEADEYTPNTDINDKPIHGKGRKAKIVK